jgi:RNA polymerase-binding transcription factor DksA
VDQLQYKERLLQLERHLEARTAQEAGRGRAQGGPGVVDTGDASVADEDTSESFSEAQLYSTVLTQVRDALRRIDARTFGKCLVDGRPIEANRLDASPWVPYCLKHQKLIEAAARLRFPSL